MTKDQVTSDLAGLNELDVVGLSAVWQRHLGGRAPDHLPRSLLARLFAYRLQVQLRGDPSKHATSYLKKIEADLKARRSVEAPYADHRRLRPGVQLVREHEGVLHRVIVLEDAFAWNGKNYLSLSAVAKAITGTHWNGNRFFGLTGSAKSMTEITP